jgi:outer membrane receptor protein involved in Fe transport
MKNIFFALLGILFLLPVFGQKVKGVVVDRQNGQPIPGVNVVWEGTTNGTASGIDGSFSLSLHQNLPHTLVFSFVGYATVQLAVEEISGKPLEISMAPSVDIDAVEIRSSRSTFSMSAAGTLNAEQINRGVLRKAACCNLSESFGATASVDVVMNDAVTGSRKIQMLGLEGVYVQNLFEGIPFARGLSNVMGFDGIPGPWINNIQLTKGIGSGVNGYESMTGQINLEFLPPDDAEERVHADLFASNQGRYEANVIYNKLISKRWSTAFFAGGATQQREMDQNNDRFLDMPLRDGIKLMNRWQYAGKRLQARFVARYSTEERTSGELGYQRGEQAGSAKLYGFGLDFEEAEFMTKLAFLSEKRLDRSLGILAAYTYTDVGAFFGDNRYSGTEHNARINSIFETRFSRFSDHSIRAGLHFQYDDFAEAYRDSAFSRTELVPGAFAEYTYSRPRFTAVFGARNDYHNLFGNQLSPRVHLKYDFRPLTTVRATLGRGFRAPNAYADQLGLLATSRTVRVLDTPQAESSWNTGLSFLHKVELFGREAFFNVDYYYTTFENQLVVDRDEDPQLLLFYNLDGRSTAHSVQGDFQAEPFRGLGVKLSYKYQEVQVDYQGGSLEKPLIPRHRALFNVGYTTASGHWYFDLTANYYSSQRLPGTESNPPAQQLGSLGQSYYLLNGQITRIFDHFEVYVGAENLNNFIQTNAIIDAENPFGPYFDASMIYGPLNGRMFYAGVRLTLKTKK